MHSEKINYSLIFYFFGGFFGFLQKIHKWIKERTRRANWVSGSTHSYKIGSEPFWKNIFFDLNSMLVPARFLAGFCFSSQKSVPFYKQVSFF